MCGIFALLNRQITEQAKNAFMLGKKRGPEISTINQYNNNIVLGFHRLAINGLNVESNQPLIHNDIKLICNGEIYNFKELCITHNIKLQTESDCEVIIHLYEKYGMDFTIKNLDGVFAFILIDSRDVNKEKVFVARDPFGVRPLYMFNTNDKANNIPIYGFASEMKILTDFSFEYLSINITAFSPSSYSIFETNSSNILEYKRNVIYYIFPSKEISIENIDTEIYNNFSKAIKKRVIGTTDRPIACLLSGGLDSSIVCALVSKYYIGTLETYSIGLADSEDLKFSKKVADHLNTKHTQIIMTEDEFFNAIPEVIKDIESYDTTTIRASVGNYLIGKYIAAHSEAKVIFNGDGSDELMGWLYVFS